MRVRHGKKCICKHSFNVLGSKIIGDPKNIDVFPKPSPETEKLKFVGGDEFSRKNILDEPLLFTRKVF